MITIKDYTLQEIGVLGLGRSGLAAAKALMAGQAHVRAWDDNASRRAKALAEGIPLYDLGRLDMAKLQALVLSPGIPHTYPVPHPYVAAARRQGVPLISDISLLAQTQTAATYVGITGTNGKSTTTALLGHILQGERQVEIGGNIGTPVLSLEPLQEEGIYVLELSSYQLELSTTARWHVAVLLNLTPDHLQRHGGMLGYIEAKKIILHNQQPDDVAIIGVDDEHCRAIYEEYKGKGIAKVVGISAHRPVEGGVYIQDGMLIDDINHHHHGVLDVRPLGALAGDHNGQNLAAAYAAARSLGLSFTAIEKRLPTFQGLPHRQERIATIDHILYINDSKATNVLSVATALKTLENYDAIFWIAGGQPKDDDILSLSPFFPRIRHAFLIGEATESFAQRLEGHVPVTRAYTLAVATQQAREAAIACDSDRRVILLSPACASLDQFNDFEHRGETFRRLVADLPGHHEGTGTRFTLEKESLA